MKMFRGVISVTGIVAAVSKQQKYQITGPGQYNDETTGSLVIGSGIFIVIVVIGCIISTILSIFGFIAILKESSRMLKIYGVVTIIAGVLAIFVNIFSILTAWIPPATSFFLAYRIDREF